MTTAIVIIGSVAVFSIAVFSIAVVLLEARREIRLGKQDADRRIKLERDLREKAAYWKSEAEAASSRCLEITNRASEEARDLAAAIEAERTESRALLKKVHGDLMPIRGEVWAVLTRTDTTIETFLAKYGGEPDEPEPEEPCKTCGGAKQCPYYKAAESCPRDNIGRLACPELWRVANCELPCPDCQEK
jgi:hypothetical protein